MLPHLDPTTSAYSLENAYVLMRASQATYSLDRESYDGRLDELGMPNTNHKWIQSQFDACFVGWTDDWVILAFRGTANAGGWVSNIAASIPAARPRDYYGKIHPGFADALDVLWNELFAELSSPSHQGKKLFVTGHSRGGAIATLAAQSLYYRGIKPTAVYTFGAPRAGNSTFANRYDIAHHYRIENDRDIVPHVPPQPLFAHVGERYWIDPNGAISKSADAETPASPVILAALKASALPAAVAVGAPLLGGVVSQSPLASEFFTDHANTEYAHWLWNSLPEPAREDARSTPYP
jgi:triacylglycerol lipase